jgi:hypothetical protein
MKAEVPGTRLDTIYPASLTPVLISELYSVLFAHGAAGRFIALMRQSAMQSDTLWLSQYDACAACYIQSDTPQVTAGQILMALFGQWNKLLEIAGKGIRFARQTTSDESDPYLYGIVSIVES